MTENFVTLNRENCWENGSTLLTHVLKTPDEEIYRTNSKLVCDRRRCLFSLTLPMTNFAPLLMFLKSQSYVNMELINCLAVEPRIYQTKTDPVENIQMKMRMKILKTDCIPIQFTQIGGQDVEEETDTMLCYLVLLSA